MHFYYDAHVPLASNKTNTAKGCEGMHFQTTPQYKKEQYVQYTVEPCTKAILHTDIKKIFNKMYEQRRQRRSVLQRLQSVLSVFMHAQNTHSVFQNQTHTLTHTHTLFNTAFSQQSAFKLKLNSEHPRTGGGSRWTTFPAHRTRSPRTASLSQLLLRRAHKGQRSSTPPQQ